MLPPFLLSIHKETVAFHSVFFLQWLRHAPEHGSLLLVPRLCQGVQDKKTFRLLQDHRSLFTPLCISECISVCMWPQYVQFVLAVSRQRPFCPKTRTACLHLELNLDPGTAPGEPRPRSAELAEGGTGSPSSLALPLQANQS